MGGLDKGGNFRLLETAVRRRAKALVLVGKASDTIRAALGALVPTVQAPDMASAVGAAARLAARGEVVLLSPGCASFDMYQNYQARGEDFRQAVQRLAEMKGP